MTENTRGKKRTGTGAAKTRKKPAAKRAKQPEVSQGITIKEEVLLWLVIALSVVIFISNLGFGGVVGNAVSAFLFGVFGFLAYLLPFVLLLVIAFNISNKGNRAVWVKTGASIALWLALCALTELLVNGGNRPKKILDYYRLSAEYKSGGGLVGGLISRPLSAGLGLAGAYALLLIFGIICVVLITEKSLFTGMKKGGSRMYQSARKDADFLKEKSALRREQREIARRKKLEEERARLLRNQEELERMQREPRMEHKVSGVSLDTRIDGAEESGKAQTRGEPEIFSISQETVPASASAPFREPEAPRLFFDVGEPSGEEPEEFIEIPLSEAIDIPLARDVSENLEIPEAGDLPEAMSFSEDRDSSGVPDFSETRELPADQEIPAERREAAALGAAPEKKEKNPRSSAEEQEEGRRAVAEEIAATAKAQPPKYEFPPLSLLSKPRGGKAGETRQELQATAAKLQKTLHDFGVEVSVTSVSCGPSVTRYELTPKQGVKVSRIVNLADDIKLNLAAEDIRIEAPIPGKAAVGIEVPNKENSPVRLREILESPEFQKHPSSLAFAAGKDIAGKVVVTDIAKMPHLLIAGATGSGKSVCINTIIMSILYKARPEDVKLIMIDPKVVELSVYNGIPHLFIPVVTDPKKAAGALNWGVAEMMERYKKFADLNVRDLKGYNEKVESIKDIEEEGKPEKLPQIVIIVDELADLMMVAPGEVEDSICRLAQLARAAGIHLIIATQRPSVNVITGLIKANMPSRIAFAVSSGVDSRTIIDMNGAEKLLGKGDMLFYPQGYPKPARVQGAFVTDEEVGEVVRFLSQKNSNEAYTSGMEEQIVKVQRIAEQTTGGGEVDAHFAEAGRFIIEKDKASIGMLQRMYKIGFNRAARIMDQLADAGVVGPEEGTKPRKVLMTAEEFERYLEESV